ncbi:MAG: CsbD family protein [Thermoanaerobaculia bacterium]
MTNHEAHGKVDKLTGKVKEAAGILTGNEELEEQGATQRAKGAVEEQLGKAQRKVGDLVESVGKAIKE